MKNKTESRPILEEAADTVLSVLAGALTLPTIANSWAVEQLSEKEFVFAVIRIFSRLHFLLERVFLCHLTNRRHER